ncbi:MAG: hypothetical protein DRO88_01940 [Promethearchaeia archaeon]|nr:MAG: hypothetical protein DRO88_01940 [Candidatus Lokiarchaeia archaeon]
MNKNNPPSAISSPPKKRLPKKIHPPYHFDCIQCGRCCSDRNTIVNLTYSDILRMEAELNYSLEDFLKVIGFYHFDHTPTDKELEKLVVPPIETEHGLAFVGLRKKKNGRCIFLSKKNKCRIYNARPNICRTFPFHFHSSPVSFPQKGLDVHMDLTKKAIEYCPGLDSEKEIVKEDWMEIGKMTTAALLKEVVLVKKWNQAVANKKIVPRAKNYLGVVLNLLNERNKEKHRKSGKKHFQSRVKLKLQKKKK